jgi:RHS repeat-associated protein
LQQIDRTSASDPTHVITQYQYTTAGLLEDINNYSQTTNTTTNISHYHYTYDPGNRLVLTTGTDGNKAVDYSNDNQIKTVTTSTGTNEAYQFDTLGNRSTWSTDPLDSRRLLNDGTYKYLYDDEGNLTDKTEIATGKITTYQWDYRNRLVSVTSDSHTIEYLYDAQDKRVGRQLDGMIQERYIYDGEDIALVVTAQGTLVERYLYGDSTDSVLAVERDGTISWSLADRQGSIVDLVDEGGTVLNHFVYDSFGSRTQTSSVEFRYGYTGRELDRETGLYYYRARYYAPTTGRFISEDPMGFGAGDTNLYRYVFNSPTNATDPSGEVFFIPFLIAAAEVAVTGALALGAFNVVKQDLKIIEGSQDRFKWGEFGSSLATGAVFNLAAATSPIAAAGLLAYGFVTGIQEGVQDWNAGHKLSGAFEIGTSLLALFGAKKFAGEIHGLPENFKDAHKAWWEKSDGWANDAFNKDIFPQKGNQNVNVEDKGQYKDSYRYEIGGHKVDLRTSPIEIPGAVDTVGGFKAGRGINGKGNDPFWQVEFKWTQGEWNYNARWHSERQGAPKGAGKPWAVTRTKEGTGGGRKYVETGNFKKNGEPIMRMEKIPSTKAIKEIYLQYPDQWADYAPYKLADKKISRTPEDNKLLDRGHWRDNVRIFRNRRI